VFSMYSKNVILLWNLNIVLIFDRTPPNKIVACQNMAMKCNSYYSHVFVHINDSKFRSDFVVKGCNKL